MRNEIKASLRFVAAQLLIAPPYAIWAMFNLEHGIHDWVRWLIPAVCCFCTMHIFVKRWVLEGKQ